MPGSCAITALAAVIAGRAARAGVPMTSVFAATPCEPGGVIKIAHDAWFNVG
jgi:hypothetical protein